MKLFAASLIAGAFAGSPVGKVIELLDDLKQKVQADLAEEGKQMSAYSEFCDDELTQKGFAIKTAARSIKGYEAAIEDASGSIEKLTANLEELGGDIAKKQAEKAQAASVRKNENGDFKAAEKELVEAVDTLARAIVIIKREMGFLQTGKGKAKVMDNSDFKKLAGALNAVMTAAGSWGVDDSSREKVQNFMQDDDASLLEQPQAATYEYENKSGGIVAALEDMKDKAEGQLQQLRREETKAKHSFELLAQSLADAVTNAEKDASNAQASLSSAKESLAQNQGDLATTQASKKADEEYSARLDSECKAKAAEWDARQKEGAAELKAISEGRQVLASGVKVSLAQTSLKTRKSLNDSGRDAAVELLKKMGRKYNSFALLEMANHAGSDPFVKIRGMIEQMINRLTQQAQEEATHESFCQEELAKSDKAKENKSNRADKYQTRIDKAKAGIQTLKGEIAELGNELSEIAKSTKAATELRNNEHATFVKGEKDYKESIEAVNNAIAVLSQFYRGESFLQAPQLGGKRGDSGHVIIEILEQAESDFSRTLADMTASEEESAAAHKALLQENNVAKSTKTAEVKGKESEVKSLTVALGNHQEDFSTVSKELNAVLDYLSKLRPQCESKAMTYEERKSRRDAEISGLKEALELLSGDASFLQRGL